MSEKINWTLNVQVGGGPKITESKTILVEGYDKIEVDVRDGAAAEDIQIQPGDSGQVQFLLIRSDEYGEDLTYSVNAAEPDPTQRIKLDALQVLMGDGAVGLLGASPQTFFLYNALGKDVSLQILVGRKVTTP
jgi:hypothetical protein